MTQPTAPNPSLDALRAEVIDVAARRFMRVGFKSVTMDDIARELGRSKKTLYTVVANKRELIDLVLDADMAADDAAVDAASAEAHDAIDEMLRIAEYFTENINAMSPAAIYDLQKYYRPCWERLDAHHNDKMIGHVRANLRRGQAEGLYRDDMDRELIAHLFVHSPKVLFDPDRQLLTPERSPTVLKQWMLYHLLGVCSPAGRERLTDYLERTPKA